jgi:hypothetical protein
VKDKDMRLAEKIMADYIGVLNFLKSRFPMYHRSNFFFRDLQYGIQMMLLEEGERVSYSTAETIGRALIEKFERDKIFIPIDRQTWAVDYPEFTTPRSKPVAPASSAGSPAAGQSLEGSVTREKP